jgi:intracellular sulfur oxidation DsrE/DsrF family protein
MSSMSFFASMKRQPDLAASLPAEPAVHADAVHVILHVGTAAVARSPAVLDRAEGILETGRASGRSLAVEIVANGGGLKLLIENTSAQAARLRAQRAAYPELVLVACGQTVQRLREGGAGVRLLPGTVTASSALDQIVLRMQQGWTYLRT